MIHAPGATSAGERHEQLWSRLFAECPDRHRQKIINTTRKRFHNFIARGTWTREQDDELSQLIEIHGTAWSKIAGLINRHPEDLRDRYRNYIICGSTQRKDPWDDDEKLRLAGIVVETIRQIDHIRFQEPHRKDVQGKYEEVIDWQDVSRQMNRTRSRLQCITKWKSMNATSSASLISGHIEAEIAPQLEAAREQIGDISVQERYRLCLSIRESKAAVDHDIPWDDLVDAEFRSNWQKPSLVLLWQRLVKAVPDRQRLTTQDCAQYLIDEYNRSNELPDVDDIPVDDHEEMQALAAVSGGLKAAPTPAKSPKRRKSRKNLSEEHVAEEDAADDHPVDEELTAEQPAEEQPEEEETMQIDPALQELSKSAEEKIDGAVDAYAVTDEFDEPAKVTPKKRKAT